MFIAENTIAGLMDQFLAQVGIDDEQDVDAFTDALGAFFDSRFVDWSNEVGIPWDTEKAGFALIFFVAGYDADGIRAYPSSQHSWSRSR